ncbi:hypothetical protein [Actinophytocola xanthii]|uniref:Uncharacterized protein n=1 Tax=Actinophytocola xanthii TaxID=1912961 RepID=A0A1Q8CQL5_9PSEU|nr:hypothetical protein [Actinophytocola xanthii]OLF16648.1 hypothetical protein BU204_15725 [Actinophytocola xanthii]
MLSDWWNGVELWVLGLAFPFQFALVMAVLAPLCLVVAWFIDRVIDHAAALFGPSPADDRPLGSAPPVLEVAPELAPEVMVEEAGSEEDGSEGDGDEQRVPAASAGR